MAGLAIPAAARVIVMAVKRRRQPENACAGHGLKRRAVANQPVRRLRLRLRPMHHAMHQAQRLRKQQRAGQGASPGQRPGRSAPPQAHAFMPQPSPDAGRIGDAVVQAEGIVIEHLEAPFHHQRLHGVLTGLAVLTSTMLSGPPGRQKAQVSGTDDSRKWR